MSKSEKKLVEIRQRRIFSEEFKRQKVKLIVEKSVSLSDIAELYGVTKMTVYRWLYQYSPHHQKGTNVVVQMESEEHKAKQLLQQVAELERALGQKQLRIDYLEKLISIGSADLGVDLKKTIGSKLWNGSESTAVNTAGK